jgi:hypothetical protein
LNRYRFSASLPGRKIDFPYMQKCCIAALANWSCLIKLWAVPKTPN